MKRFILLVCLFLFSFFVKGQAHLGATESEIRQLHSSNVFKSDYTKDGNKYIMTDFDYGTFIYYFDKQSGLSYLCFQVPFNSKCINSQVTIYNAKYTKNSSTSWTAYLEDGGIMDINLIYDDDLKISVFHYTNAK